MSRQNDDDEEYRHFGGIEQPKRTKMVAFEICPLRVIATFAFIYFALSDYCPGSAATGLRTTAFYAVAAGLRCCCCTTAFDAVAAGLRNLLIIKSSSI